MKRTKQEVPGHPVLQWFWCRLEQVEPDLPYDLLSLGFRVCWEGFDEDGTAHIPMQM